MEEEKSSTWGIQVTPETRDQINRLLSQIGGKNKKESFENMLNMVEFHVTRRESKTKLCRKMDELNEKMFALRDAVQDIIEVEEQELHDTKKQLEAMKQTNQKLEADISALRKERADLKKELKYLKEISRLSQNPNPTNRKGKETNQDKKEVKDSGQLYLKLD